MRGGSWARPIGDLQTRRRIGYLPELFRYQDWLTAREVLKLHCALARLPRRQWTAEIDRVLGIVGLATRSRDRVGTFSKGMQQRLGLGVALLGQPDLVFLDEPTSALDPVGRHDVREIIRDLKSHGATVFLNSHLLTEVEHVCDRIAVIDHGRVIAAGALDELIGETNTVRLRLEGLSAVSEAALCRFGALAFEEGWHVVRGIDDTVVPDLVAEMVRLGVRIHAVEPRRQSLEERFLQILKGAADAPPAPSPAMPTRRH